jgi:hypothetical protein
VRSLGIRGGRQANATRPVPGHFPPFPSPALPPKTMAKTHLGLPLRARTKVVGKSSAVRDGRRLGDDGRRLVIETKI